MVEEAARPPGGPSGAVLPPVSMALGIAGFAVSLIPFYGLFTGLPLSVTALVLGLVAGRGAAAA